MRRRAEVVEHLTPSRVICCTATMTLVDHHQVEEVCRELPEDLLPFFAPGHSLVQRQVDLVILLDLSVCDLERANLARETKYSLFRRRLVGSTYVWHIHGESEVPNSITLGYDQYSGYLQKLRSHATADRSDDQGSPFKQGNTNFDQAEGVIYSWLDVFLRDDIHIVGLGLDYTEIDLWWALTYKARLRARGWPVGRTIVHDWHSEPPDEQVLARRSLLKGLSVDVRSRECGADYELAYDSFLKSL